ncbi:MAG: murein biosynthesis integral membrane protein MurJ [Chloroflexi bacterium]|nr:murein biosynthesis integral membrane protein MurJ [Chloroflexota bacterium]MBK7918388.1 murein biosynthesis integral membrane protein MurJ [Chloroflexota bacterium]MBP6802958.1 murein biosynthesis integral membrane protein MurJ [Chloroflexota bacterium]
MNRARHLLQSSIIVILLLGLDKLLGLVRTQLVSAAFGTSRTYDAFTAANQLPEVFVTLISGGALAAAFIPVYSAYLTKEKAQESGRLANTILTLVLIILSGVSALGAIFAPWITRHILVPGFPPDLQLLTANLMRIILIQTTIFGISGVLSSILNAHQHFILPALAPIALNVGYLTGLFLLVPRLGIFGLAWGTVIGAVLHVLIQLPGLQRYRVRIRPAFKLKMSGVHEIIRLMGPRIVTLGAVQIADLFIIRITSGLNDGATSGYFYGYYLQQLPETLFGTAVALVLFPTMAEMYNNADINGLKRVASTGLRIIWMLTVPAALGLVLLGKPAITLLLERGAFTPESTQLVYSIVVFFSVRVVSEATLEIAARLFFAQHDTKTPMIVALGWLVTNIILAYWLVGILGVSGLALASTIAFTLQTAVLLYLNHRRLHGLDWRELGLSFGRTLLAATGMALVILGIGRFIAQPLPFLLIGGATGLGAYLLLNLLLGGRELPALLNLIRRQKTTTV